tara:strand:- start:22 stop:264 length:243 start_codon:yes stop_codon:yes gene_type:complete
MSCLSDCKNLKLGELVFTLLNIIFQNLELKIETWLRMKIKRGTNLNLLSENKLRKILFGLVLLKFALSSTFRQLLEIALF